MSYDPIDDVPTGLSASEMVGRRVRNTIPGRKHWTGTVLDVAGVHGDMIKVSRDGHGVGDHSTEDWKLV